MRATAGRSMPAWETLEVFVRGRIQEILRGLLEEGVTEFLGRAPYQRREADGPRGYRNGYGKPRRVTLMTGTVAVRRPRLRGLWGEGAPLSAASIERPWANWQSEYAVWRARRLAVSARAILR